ERVDARRRHEPRRPDPIDDRTQYGVDAREVLDAVRVRQPRVATAERAGIACPTLRLRDQRVRVAGASPRASRHGLAREPSAGTAIEAAAGAATTPCSARRSPIPSPSPRP